MLKTLIKARLSSVFFTMNFSGRTGKARKAPAKTLVIVAAVYIAACLALMSCAIFLPLCRPFVDEGYGWFYFAFAGIMAFVICFIGSVFSTQAQLFEAKDNELLLSMPIPPSKILMSRMIFLLLTNYAYEAFVMLPAGIIYIYCYPGLVSFVSVAAFIICFLTLPMLVLSLSSLFGWGLALLTARVRYKNIFVTAASAILLVGYFTVYFKIETYMEYLINNGSEFANAVKNAVFPAYYFGQAISDASVWDTVLFVIFTVLPFIVAYLVISAFFFKIVTANHGISGTVYKRRIIRKKSAMTALLGKELKFFASRPLYIMNTALGTIFMLVISVLVVVKGTTLINAITVYFPELSGDVPAMVCLLLCLIASFNTISSPSVSLEGKTLWIPKSIPVEARDVLLSKVMMHFAICAPFSLVSSFICIFALEMSVFEMILMIVAPLAITAFQAFFGVAVNLNFPKFDWTSETVVIKQSASVIITMLGTLALVGIPAIVHSEFLGRYVDSDIFLLVFTLCFAAGCIGLYRYIVTKGVKMFEAF